MNWFKKFIQTIWKYISDSDNPEPKAEPEKPDGATDLINLKGWTTRGITFRGGPRDWQEQNGDLSGDAILEIFRDGKWQGGKFEHCRNHMTYRGWENIKNDDPEHNQPYGIFKTLRPKAGEQARFRLISYNSKQFTNWIESTWK